MLEHDPGAVARFEGHLRDAVLASLARTSMKPSEGWTSFQSSRVTSALRSPANAEMAMAGRATAGDSSVLNRATGGSGRVLLAPPWPAKFGSRGNGTGKHRN